MTPLPDLIRRAGMTPVVIVKNHSTDDEERVRTEAQLMNSSEAYFAIEDRLYEGDHVEMRDPRGGLILKVAAEVEQHPMPASMASAFGGSNGYTKVKWGKDQPVRQAPVRRLDLQHLHAEVVSSASALFADSQYDSAVTEAMKSVEVRVRRLTGLEVSGAALMQEAFKPKNFMLDVGVEEGRSGSDEREGFFYLFRGAIVGIRNPKAHELARGDDPNEALELLALASLLHRRLDIAEARLT
ncbi:TIGR02391 family protein [Brevibacterium sp.]|uniref:TIGR02391 family protein n=1 Tax=Brevibacterium sp. TaxID=1701 RepID=UPI0028113E88|nr:TIGR02391 family protein [Brevibacterium sp.]